MDLQHSAIWMAGVYLMLLMQFLENKVAVDLTRSEFVEAQEVGGRLPLPCSIICLSFSFSLDLYLLTSLSLSIYRGLNWKFYIFTHVFTLFIDLGSIYF